MDGLKIRASAAPPAPIPALFVAAIVLIRERVFSKKQDFDLWPTRWKANPLFIC
jgi:hypothetical protein